MVETTTREDRSKGENSFSRKRENWAHGFEGEGLKYQGKDYDQLTGLVYMNARWYDPEIGRFISEDPARDGGNWYAFVSNNPLRFTDPSGLFGAHEDSGVGVLDDTANQLREIGNDDGVPTLYQKTATIRRAGENPGAPIARVTVAVEAKYGEDGSTTLDFSGSGQVIVESIEGTAISVEAEVTRDPVMTPGIDVDVDAQVVKNPGSGGDPLGGLAQNFGSDPLELTMKTIVEGADNMSEVIVNTVVEFEFEPDTYEDDSASKGPSFRDAKDDSYLSNYTVTYEESFLDSSKRGTVEGRQLGENSNLESTQFSVGNEGGDSTTVTATTTFSNDDKSQ